MSGDGRYNRNERDKPYNIVEVKFFHLGYSADQSGISRDNSANGKHIESFDSKFHSFSLNFDASVTPQIKKSDFFIGAQGYAFDYQLNKFGENGTIDAASMKNLGIGVMLKYSHDWKDHSHKGMRTTASVSPTFNDILVSDGFFANPKTGNGFNTITYGVRLEAEQTFKHGLTMFGDSYIPVAGKNSGSVRQDTPNYYNSDHQATGGYVQTATFHMNHIVGEVGVKERVFSGKHIGIELEAAVKILSNYNLGMSIDTYKIPDPNNPSVKVFKNDHQVLSVNANLPKAIPTIGVNIKL